jgi:hypothetical protein
VKFCTVTWEIYFRLIKFEVFTTEESRISWVCGKVVIIIAGFEERAASFFRVEKKSYI